MQYKRRFEAVRAVFAPLMLSPMASDYDRLLQQASNPQLSESERRYAFLVNKANQFSSFAYFFLAFFFAYAFDKQITAWNASSIQDQANVGFVLAGASFLLFWVIYKCLMCRAGDPMDEFVFEANEQQQQASAAVRPKQAVIGGLAISHNATAAGSPLLVSPLASLNSKPPSTPAIFNWMQRQQQAKYLAAASTVPAKREESISPDVLKFNPSMKSMMHRT